jgi:hypothetical protein
MRLMCVMTAALAIAAPAAANPPVRTADGTGDAWARTMAELSRIPATVASLSMDPKNPDLYAQSEWQTLSAIAQFILDFRSQDPNFPKFLPFGNEVLNVNPVPDYMFRLARINGAGTYRISGYRGTSRFVEIQEMIGLDENSAQARKLVSRFELDDLKIGRDGSFSVLLSATRPAGYRGDWIRLEPDVTTLLVREAAYDWAREVDARIAIVRLDAPAPGPQVTPQILDAQLERLPGWVRDRIGRWTEYMTKLRDEGNINTLRQVDFTGSVRGQAYYETTFDINPDEALVLETEVPKTCRYWGVLVGNETYMTVDWTRFHSSINGGQARLDRDGRFRAVISLTDPGVANWVDTGHNKRGVIQFRWSRCSSTPLPQLTKIRLSEVNARLPADTIRVNAAERQEEMIERRTSAQLRRRW